MIRSAVESPGEPAPGETVLVTLERLAQMGKMGSDTDAVVDSVDGDSALHRRLLESGFTAGIGVRFVMATPFGDPLVFALRGASIALRKNEARCVKVRIPVRVSVSHGNGRVA